MARQVIVAALAEDPRRTLSPAEAYELRSLLLHMAQSKTLEFSEGQRAAAGAWANRMDPTNGAVDWISEAKP